MPKSSYHMMQLRIDDIHGVPGRQNDTDMRAATSRFIVQTLALANIGAASKLVLEKLSNGTMRCFCSIDQPRQSALVTSLRQGESIAYTVGGLFPQRWVLREASAEDCKDYAELVVDRLLLLNRQSVRTLEHIKERLDAQNRASQNDYDVMREAWSREGLEAGI